MRYECTYGIILNDAKQEVLNMCDTNTQILIADAFGENKYNLFVRYCEDNGLKYLNDLESFDFESLRVANHIGTGKINSIKKRYAELSGRSIEDLAVINAENLYQPLFNTINDEISDIDIEFLCAFGLQEKSIKQLHSVGYKIIGDFRDVSESVLRKRLTPSSFERLASLRDMLGMGLADLVALRLKELESESDYMITILRAEGYTLQAIGDSYKVTRERIRQVVNKFEKKIAPMITPLWQRMMKERGYILGADVIDLYDNNKMNMVIFMWLKDCEELEYLDFADVFVPFCGSKNYHRRRILDIAVEFVGDGIDITDHLDDLENLMFKNGYPFMDEAAFLNLLQSEKYYVYNGYIVKGRQSYGLLCSRIVERRFPQGIKVYESQGSEDLNILRKLAYRTYGDIGISDDDRAFSSRLIDYLILCDKGRYTARANIRVDMAVIRKIRSYIEQSNEQRIYYSLLFEMFKHELMTTGNIDNYHFLHGVLKMFYESEEELDFRNKDFLTKTGKGFSSGRPDDKILQIVESGRIPVGKLVLKMKIPGLSDSMIINATMANERLIQWEPNYYYSLNCIDCSEDDKAFLRETIQRITGVYRGYCSEGLLYEAILKDRASFLQKNQMTSPDNLYYFCSKILSNEFEFRKPHITRFGLVEEISAKSVALHLLKDPTQLSYTAFREIGADLKWSDVNMSAVFSDIEQDYIRVAEDIYVKREEFLFNSLDIERIELTLRQIMQGRYITMMNFDKWNMLPMVPYEWNPFLLRSVIETYIPELKIVDTRKKYRPYERGVIVDAESPFIEYTDIVIFSLREMNKLEIDENELRTFLIDGGMAYKVIPEELYVSNKIKYKDGLFIIPERKV